MKIQVINFQSIKNQTIDTEGLTVITGPSNNGKSALVRAMRACLLGLPGTHYVRRGQEWCAVGIKGQDFEVKWRKAVKVKVGKETALEVNGTKFSKIGRDHAQLTEEVGVTELKIANSKPLSPQIASQHNPIFLIGESETTAAEILKKLSRVDVVTKAQLNALKDRREAEGLIKIRSVDLEEVEKKIDELKGVETLRQVWKAAEKAIVSLVGKSEKGEESRQEILKLIDLKEVTVPQEIVLPQLPPLKDMKQLMELVQLQVPDVVVLPAMVKGKSLLSEIQVVDQELLGVKDKLYGADKEIELLQGEIKEVEKELGVCPTCQRVFE